MAPIPALTQIMHLRILVGLQSTTDIQSMTLHRKCPDFPLASSISQLSSSYSPTVTKNSGISGSCINLVAVLIPCLEKHHYRTYCILSAANAHDACRFWAPSCYHLLSNQQRNLDQILITLILSGQNKKLWLLCNVDHIRMILTATGQSDLQLIQCEQNL